MWSVATNLKIVALSNQQQKKGDLIPTYIDYSFGVRDDFHEAT